MDLVIKGFLIGLGKIIPGVSGSIIAIRLRVYEKMIASINNFFKDFKTSVYYLGKLGLGIILAILIGSHIIIYLLDNYYIPTLFIFFVLIATGLPMIIKKTHDYVLAVITFILYFAILGIPSLNVFHNYYFMGFLEAFTTIIPGISGTALFMSLGLYDEVLNMFSNLYLFPFKQLIPFGIGALLGTLIISHFIDYCFKHHHSKTYAVILGLTLASMVSLIIKR